MSGRSRLSKRSFLVTAFAAGTLALANLASRASCAEVLEIHGVKFSEARVAKDLKDLPDLYEPDKDQPTRWAQRKEVFDMPLADNIWLKFPASKGRFYIQYRDDRNKPETERTYGPIEGDPFVKMQLEEKMLERLKKDYAPDDYYRMRLMVRTQEKGLIERALRLVIGSCEGDGEISMRESMLPALKEVLEQGAAGFKEYGLEQQVEVAKKRIAAIEAKIADLTVTLPDEEYQPGEAADSLVAKSIPAEAWTKPNQGLAIAVIPTATEVAIGDSIGIQVIAKNMTEKPIKFGSHDLTQGVRPRLKDAAGKDVAVRSSFFTGLSPIHRHILKPGEVLILVVPTVKFVSKGTAAEAGFGDSVAPVEPGKYQVQFEFHLPGGGSWSRGTDGVMRKTLPAKGEWSGVLSSKPLEIVVK